MTTKQMLEKTFDRTFINSHVNVYRLKGSTLILYAENKVIDGLEINTRLSVHDVTTILAIVDAAKERGETGKM